MVRGGKCELVVKKEKRSSSGSGDEYYWVKILLQSKFFGSCECSHDQQKKNVFCIDCNLGFCRHCMINIHRFHRCLQICKYVYHDVLRFQDIHKHLDCSKIQTYKINGEKAVHLNPRPQSKDSKPSTKLRTGTTCQACGKYLQDHPNRFCSIACKVWVVEMESKLEEEIDEDVEERCRELEEEKKKKSSSSSTGICWRDFCDDLQEEEEVVVEWSNNNSLSNYCCSSSTTTTSTIISSSPNSKIKRSSFKRKGIPQRAPLR